MIATRLTEMFSLQHPIALIPDESQRDAITTDAQRRFGGWGGLIVGTPDEIASAPVNAGPPGDSSMSTGDDRFVPMVPSPSCPALL